MWPRALHIQQKKPKIKETEKLKFLTFWRGWHVALLPFSKITEKRRNQPKNGGKSSKAGMYPKCSLCARFKLPRLAMVLYPRCVLCVNSNLFLQELVAELLKWHFKEKSTKSQLCAFLTSSMLVCSQLQYSMWIT